MECSCSGAALPESDAVMPVVATRGKTDGFLWVQVLILRLSPPDQIAAPEHCSTQEPDSRNRGYEKEIKIEVRMRPAQPILANGLIRIPT